jgi:hypothetical protein
LGVKSWKDYAPYGRVIRFGVLNKEKALHPPSASAGVYFFIALSEASFLRAIKK